MKAYVPNNIFRRATHDDMALIWQWRNQANIRKVMFNSQPIEWLNHQDWFVNMLASHTPDFWVFTQNKRPVGVLSFSNPQEKFIYFGFYLGEENVWPGTGMLMEVAALDYICSLQKFAFLRAEVLSSNQQVIKLHQRFGYEIVDIQEGFLEQEGSLLDKIIMERKVDNWLSDRHVLMDKLPQHYQLALNQLVFE
ncbi:UDP-4-amino-4,6-dideoxy-N-acetyl-beta-L-altrosamine N-acetyltransferase [Thiosulfativibrio zosterae]|uniref:N-acetyltransferase domain-containing protein n=1 Tax=Thiosulfativibrio zosterae TaxID=2675053 RepID=A0A6F8PLZ3_9GAMM|nr:UDP-4-amino-4,6-dideoxy-N-acetyl-beta-L-altrosamine N-acetyltransferase [Thiosulfativibrio zosterae]BBP43088.1 hypothetical protein THMIRHAT_08340 [Thiosulfativibrio zosterae]